MVNTTTAGDQMYSSAAMDSNGGFVVVWSSQGQDGDGWGVYGQRFDVSGNRWWERSSMSARQRPATRCSPAWPSTAAGTSRSFGRAAAKANYWNVFGQRFDSDGNALGSEFQVNTTTSGDQHNPNIGMNAAGDFVVSWTSQTARARHPRQAV